MKARRIDEGFHQQQRVAKIHLPIIRQSLQTERGFLMPDLDNAMPAVSRTTVVSQQLKAGKLVPEIPAIPRGSL